MGKIKSVIFSSGSMSTPPFNNRLTVELCENVHLHYRNLRLEFDAAEFIQLVRHLKLIDEAKVASFAYGPNAFEAIVTDNSLPNGTWFNKRLQVETQEAGGIHIHYRNLRIEI